MHGRGGVGSTFGCLRDDLPLGTKPVDPRGNFIEGAGARRPPHRSPQRDSKTAPRPPPGWSTGHSWWVQAVLWQTRPARRATARQHYRSPPASYATSQLAPILVILMPCPRHYGTSQVLGPSPRAALCQAHPRSPLRWALSLLVFVQIGVTVLHVGLAAAIFFRSRPDIDPAHPVSSARWHRQYLSLG